MEKAGALSYSPEHYGKLCDQRQCEQGEDGCDGNCLNGVAKIPVMELSVHGDVGACGAGCGDEQGKLQVKIGFWKQG